MIKISYHIYKVVRSILMTIIVTLVALYAILYIILSIPSVQNKIKTIGEEELSKVLTTEVSIGKLSIEPFNKIVLYDVSIPDQKGNPILKAKKIGAGISIYNLLINQRFVFTYAEIIELNGYLSKETPKSPLNIQFIIDALKPKKKNQPPTKFDVRIFNIVIRKSSLSYDIKSEKYTLDKFDKNHIKLNDLTADIALPKLKNNDFIIDIKRLAFIEKCGFQIKSLTAKSIITDNSISLINWQIELPNSVITPEDFSIKFNHLNTFGSELYSIPLNFNLANNYITLSDFRGFVPKLRNFIDPMNITLALRGSLDNLIIPVLNISTENKRISLSVSGHIKGIRSKNSPSFHFPHIEMNANATEITNITSHLVELSPTVNSIITNCGNISFDGSIGGEFNNLKFIGDLYTSLGSLEMNGGLYKNGDIIKFKGQFGTANFNIGKLTNKPDLLNETAFNISLDATTNKSHIAGNIDGNVKYIDFKGYRYSNILANFYIDNKKYDGKISINDENLSINLNGLAELNGANSKFDITLDAQNLNLSKLNLYAKYPNHNLSFNARAMFVGNQLDNANGSLDLSNIKYIDNEGEGIHINDIQLSAENENFPQHISLKSDIINGDINGSFNFKNLVPSIKSIIFKAFPSLTPKDEYIAKNLNIKHKNNFSYRFIIEPDNQLTKFFNAPIEIVYPIKINGFYDENIQNCNLAINAPYLLQKDKIIEGSSFEINLNGTENIYNLKAHTLYPNKKGNISLSIDANAVNNRLDTNISWWMARKKAFNGNVSLSALFFKNKDTNQYESSIAVNPTEITINDTIWNMRPATVDLTKNQIKIENFEINSDNQFIKINGLVSQNPNDKLAVDLQNMNLDYIFGTLDISNVSFGGIATGKFYGSNLLSRIPSILTPNLHVDNFTYNNSLLGDADIKSGWDNEDKSISIKANIKQRNGYTSNVDGAIFPTKDSLYFDFKPQKLDIRFLKPFLSAVTSDIQGHGSGHAILYGNFKRIDLKGDIFADDLKFKVDYINTYYTASDSIIIRPGKLLFKNITIQDKYGHTANLNGWVNHKFFHDASFDFRITNAKNLLCLNITPQMNPNWYGTIFGNGSAFITGEPGVVNIDVNMATADNSKFTFVMSNSQAASDYNFITLNNRNKEPQKTVVKDSIPDFIKNLKQKQEQQSGTPSRFNLNLQVEATPLAKMILIMDPQGGDKIKATGDGNLRITYNNMDDEMKIFGTYTLEKGSYNFTLQDVIIKDFSIKEGSAITFHGDPMNANLNITAAYSLNANLTDLDQSFAQDKDMNRTNVPVSAILKVNGDISQPNIGFDLEFPTLTQDAYRKVRSIVSTEDMMNRQIIYLLALNRFYTPDYMGNTSKNNEFASVASSTISSQLSNILGQISDNWSIAPNFRTNKGDFSDMEVDVALSSTLLNNRLLFNGNFGYRDKSANNNNSNFIGDFDLEYLLTKNGNIRLKAYNHYNDQNYYIKSALTTQGVGVVFKRDFDNLHRRSLKIGEKVVNDSTQNDTLVKIRKRKD